MAATYCTAAQFKAASNNAALVALENAALEAKIEAAEPYIDAEAGTWEKYDITQTRRFPRAGYDVNSAGTTYIPELIRAATIAQVEFMHENQPDVEHGVEQDDEPTKLSLSPRARYLMRKGNLICRVGRIQFPPQTYGRSLDPADVI